MMLNLGFNKVRIWGWEYAIVVERNLAQNYGSDGVHFRER